MHHKTITFQFKNHRRHFKSRGRIIYFLSFQTACRHFERSENFLLFAKIIYNFDLEVSYLMQGGSKVNTPQKTGYTKVIYEFGKLYARYFY